MVYLLQKSDDPNLWVDLKHRFLIERLTFVAGRQPQQQTRKRLAQRRAAMLHRFLLHRAAEAADRMASVQRHPTQPVVRSEPSTGRRRSAARQIRPMATRALHSPRLTSPPLTGRHAAARCKCSAAPLFAKRLPLVVAFPRSVASCCAVQESSAGTTAAAATTGTPIRSLSLIHCPTRKGALRSSGVRSNAHPRCSCT